METLNTTIRDTSDTTMAGTTTFSDPINVIHNKSPTQQEKSQLYPVRDQSIADFLAKPFPIAVGIWDTAVIRNTILESSTVGTDLLTSTVWTEKLKGFNFFRGTAVYRIVLNATPFHAGCLKFGFVPFAGTEVTVPSLTPSWRTTQLAPFSTCPGVYIDCKDSTAIVRIPYVSTVDYYTLETNDSIDWGTWLLKVYAPLNTGAASSQGIGYTVYLHFEDVELAVPMHPQSGSSAKSKKAFNRFSSKVGAMAKEEIASQEAEVMAKTGSLSQGLMVAGNAVEALESIPILSSIAAPVSWVLRGASVVASWFGYSKPDVDSALTFVARNNQPHMAHATGIDASIPLALFHDNSIEMRPGFGGTDLDEMSFDYIKKVPAYFDDFTWGADALADVLLKTIVVSPKDLYQQVSAFGTILRYFPPFGYLQTFFQSYRGSIDIHFKIVKTDYHSGKLSFTFVPASGLTIPNMGQRPYLLREIVDVKDRSEVVLRIPYLQYSKYIGVEDSLGVVHVHVVNELVAPESCAQNVNILLFASAGDDFEYAVPGMNKNIFPYTSPIIPQMGGVELERDQMIVTEVVGNYPSMKATNEAACASIGEKFVSIRQLLMRFTRLATFGSPAQIGANSSFSIYPWSVAIPLASSAYTPAATFDALSRLAHGYAFMRGSIRVGMRPSSSTTRVAIANVTSLSETAQPFFQTNVPYNTSSGNSYSLTTRIVTGHSNADTVFDTGIGFPSVRVPYYCENHSTAILPVSTDVIPSDVWNSYGIALINEAGATATSTIDLRRSIGEDFSLGYFLGFPPLFFNEVL